MDDTNLKEYYLALERLKSGCPIRVPVGTPISNDSVSLEAGRGRGSIKKSRDVFSDLILKIKNEKSEVINVRDGDRQEISDLKKMLNFYKDLYYQAISRELSLVAEIYELKNKK